MNVNAFEVNFDGIVGPTHNYSGLSFGNLASMENRLTDSNPKEAALQGLEKMMFLTSLGLKQGVLPPHERPHIPTLKALGFSGSDVDILNTAYNLNPRIVYECSSAAAMWTANAATVCPSVDSINKHVQFTPANLVSKFHRSIEANFTAKVLKAIFSNTAYFAHHSPLLPVADLADEGAANHTRLCNRYNAPGIQLFVFGRYAWQTSPFQPSVYPARQTLEASQAVARLHQLFPGRAVFAQQNPKAIDAGVFHNDVVSVGNRNVFFYHEAAFIRTDDVIAELKQKVYDFCDTELKTVQIPTNKVSLKDAVDSYMFNSQLVSISEEAMALLAPYECRNFPNVQALLNEILQDFENPIKEIHYTNLHESMRNGGGPACLRLRVVLTEQELSAMHQGVLLNERLYHKLKDWINKHYRSKLIPDDLADPALLQEIRTALDELTKILNIGSIYSFQK